MSRLVTRCLLGLAALALLVAAPAANAQNTATFAMTSQATHRERIELQSSRMIDHSVHLEVVFLDRACKSRPDGVVTMLVECEPRRLEADDRLVAFAECWGSVSHEVKPYRWSRVITRTPH